MSQAHAAQPAEALNRLADELYALKSDQPEDNRLPDNSDRARRSSEKAEDALYARFLKIDANGLDETDAITHAMLRESLEADREVRSCRQHLWNIDHISGWHIRLPGLAARQPIGTAAARKSAIARWRQMPQFVGAEIGKLREGLKLGYSVPQPIVKRVIKQLDGLLALPVANSPYLSPAKRDGGKEFERAFTQIVEREIYPALRNYRDFLRDAYLPRARNSIAISALPNGEACYRAMLRRETTLKNSPQEIFDRGRAMVEFNRAASIALGKELFNISDFDAIVRLVNEAPDNKFTSAEDVLNFTKDAVDRYKRLSAPLFFRPPGAPLEVVSFPSYQRNTGMNPYYSPSKGEGAPAHYFVNLDSWKENTKGQVEVTAVHEAWPGHHLQVSVAKSLKHRNRFTENAVYGAYVEGWARYVERLADEADLYASPYARIAWRTKPGFGMVVDPGLHAFGWTRAQAAEFLKSSGLFNGDQVVEDMIDRITVMPAQLTSYDTGGSEFLLLRDLAREKLGDRFDPRKFHQQVLGAGFVPLSTLHDMTIAWIEREARR